MRGEGISSRDSAHSAALDECSNFVAVGIKSGIEHVIRSGIRA
jgi:hypothetical protein